MPDKEPPITPEIAAERLGLLAVCKDPKRAVLEMARRGQLRAVKVSKWTLIDPKSVEQVLEGR